LHAALSFFGIIHRAKTMFDCPIAAYNVSGEYVMRNLAADAGFFEKQDAMLEVLYLIKRAGGDIVTRFAKETAKLLK
jgi:porphobilinogen synthase